MNWIVYSFRRDDCQGRHDIKTAYINREAVKDFLGEHHAFQKHLRPYPHFHARLRVDAETEAVYTIFPSQAESGYLQWVAAMERRFPRNTETL